MNQEILLLLSFNKRIIAFNTLYSQITGSVKSGLLLSQFMYWWQKTNGKEFYKTKLEMQEETTLSIDEIKGALNNLKALGFINVKVKGLPPKAHITINVTKIIEAISVKPTNTFMENPQIYNVETHKYIYGKPTNTIYNTKLPHNTTSYITTDIKNTQKGEIEPEKLITYTNQYVHTPTFTRNGLEPLPPLLPSEPFIEVIDYFNKKTNSKCKHASKTIDNLKRILEKHTVDEVKLVIDYISQDDWHIKRNRVVLPVICRPTLFAEKLAIATSHKNNPNKQRKFNDVDEFPEDNPVEVDYATLVEEEKNTILWSDINDN